MSEPEAPVNHIRDRERIHALRNAINSAGLCVHAAEQLLIAGHAARARQHLSRASQCLQRAHRLLAPSTDTA